SAETVENQKQIETLKELREKTARRTYFFSVNGQVQAFLISISGIMVIVIGGISVINGMMTIGGFFAFYIAANHLQTNINIITDTFALVVTGNESLVTLYDIASKKETGPYTGTAKVDFIEGLVLQSVMFNYTGKPVLTDLSLQLYPGDRVAIIGANGAGKSTIIHLILGFYAPQSGKISVDGIPFSEVDFPHFRKHIGVVSQQPLLISDSIRNNINYGNEWASEKDVLTVSKMALAHDFIEKLPGAYDTQIGEDGILLSGGECQKIAIARALLRRPKLLILDEPTNHLDSPAVKKIMQNIDNIDYSPAILIISHDTAVIQHAHKIFVLEEGNLKLLNHQARASKT
ncbi:MAG: ABC transporter ATP-binding protein/permease, partial [Bacteroidales bacterium]|nr:ABC transporter ATP-binding protein/permease [Bacteroidales bacterium]